MIESDSENEEVFPSQKEGLKNNLLDLNAKQVATVKKPSLCLNIIYFIFPCLKKVDVTTRRKVYFRQNEQNITNWSNREENHKYSVLLFIPVVLFNQFKQFGNFFYLCLTISQIFPILKVGFLFTNLAPLCIVVCFSMLKELYDDIKRRIQDKKTNSTLVTTLSLHDDKSLNIVPKKSEEINIGDILELNKDSRVPADIIVLKTFNDSEENQAFIRTDQLDGETDWKLRKAPGVSQEMKESDLVNIDGYIEYEPPSKLIYNFNGVLFYRDNQGKMQKEPLNLENTMWASTVVASKKVIGIVVYTGKETRAKMNSSTPKYKMGVLDHELNFLNVYLAVIMVSLSLIITILKGFDIVIFIKFIVIFSSIIPIALKVNLDVSKTWFSYVISKDKNIPETIARNSNIPEELGRISYVFSDKTGTLTKNEMVFKNIAMENEIFGEEHFEDLKNILFDECSQYDSPLMDLINTSAKTEIINSNNNNNNIIDTSSSQTSIRQKKRRRERSKLIRDCITSMVLCNNVTPTDNGYQASSPDEIALVQFAESLKMVLTHRTDKNIQLKDAVDNIEDFDILANFPFSSDTKRMGIILRNKKYKHIIFYLKGAENVMTKFVKKEYIGYIKENAENLAMKGLRTLVLTQRILSEEEFQNWEKEYEEASASMINRKENMAKVVSKLENDMDFLCVTGVEDLLQDDVYSTIDNLRSAGMKIWMLTGDKVETATCISISAGIKNKKQKIFTIKYDDLIDYNNLDNIYDRNIQQNNELKTRFSINNENEEENNIIDNKGKNNKKLNEDREINCRVIKLRKLFNEYNTKILIDPHLFIIDGDSLDLALKHLEKEFFTTAMQALSVVCCRCSPTQKRIIVKTIKKYTKGRTAAVGDGGNDVAMIQEADVGIGIVGKEGLQASLAADYSIKEFKTLSILLLWWGRLAYKNTSMVANFVMHRGLIISLNQFIFSMLFYYNSVSLYNGALCLGYSTIFTALPSITLLLDQDVKQENVLKFPTLYKVLLKGRELGIKSFLWWVFKSIFQSAILMFGSILVFKSTVFLNIVTITFTGLIYLEILNVYMEINKYHWFMLVALVATFLVYTLCLIFMRSIFDTSAIDFLTLFYVLLLAATAWAPFFITSKLKKCIFPKVVEKLNMAEK
jgi:phospholipid-translocating ATPase